MQVLFCLLSYKSFCYLFWRLESVTVIFEHNFSSVCKKLCSSSSGIPSSILLRIEIPFVLASSLRLYAKSVRIIVFDLRSFGFCCLTTNPLRSMASTSLVIEFLSFCIWSARSCCESGPWFQRRSMRRNCSGVRSIFCCLSIVAVYCLSLHPAILMSTAICLDSNIGIQYCLDTKIAKNTIRATYVANYLLAKNQSAANDPGPSMYMTMKTNRYNNASSFAEKGSLACITNTAMHMVKIIGSIDSR